MSPEDLIIDGPVAGVSMDRPMAVDLDPQLTRELTNRKSSWLLSIFGPVAHDFP